MHAEIIAVGTELMTGEKLDTHSQWLSRELAAVGIPVRHHAAVEDDTQTMLAVFGAAADRSDLVIVTGGLGPTRDDLTREALSALAGTELVLDELSWNHIRHLFARRKRPMPERNRLQAMVPRGSEPIPNPHGTAPGIWMELDRGPRTCRIAALPGVPGEMRLMFHREVLPRLPVGAQVIRSARLHCFGRGESDIEARLGDLTARGREPQVGITAHEATITLRITARGETAAECEDQIAATRKKIRNLLGNMIFGEDNEELQDVVVRRLIDQRRSVSTAEAGTGGLLAHLLTGVPGYERCYPGGVIVPTRDAKRDLLGVEDALRRDGAAGAQTAAAMAAGCRNRFGTDWGLAVMRWPGPEDDRHGRERSAMHIALSGEDLQRTVEDRLAGDPAILKIRTAKSAINLLRRHLIG